MITISLSVFRYGTVINNCTNTIGRFVVLTIHYIARCVMYAQRRSMFQPGDAPYQRPRFSIPLEFIARCVVPFQRRHAR